METHLIHFSDGKQKKAQRISFDPFINVGDELRFESTPGVTHVVTRKVLVVACDGNSFRVEYDTNEVLGSIAGSDLARGLDN
ncbi:hypothetical protein [Pseudomonas sp. COR18]|uniref:hypothetical protein n=1 Tax=Pseudomonas sp. COR18 TaxID=3399680 RepID=UPI003AFFCF98